MKEYIETFDTGHRELIARMPSGLRLSDSTECKNEIKTSFGDIKVTATLRAISYVGEVKVDPNQDRSFLISLPDYERLSAHLIKGWVNFEFVLSGVLDKEYGISNLVSCRTKKN